MYIWIHNIKIYCKKMHNEVGRHTESDCERELSNCKMYSLLKDGA